MSIQIRRPLSTLRTKSHVAELPAVTSIGFSASEALAAAYLIVSDAYDDYPYQTTIEGDAIEATDCQLD